MTNDTSGEPKLALAAPLLAFSMANCTYAKISPKTHVRQSGRVLPPL